MRTILILFLFAARICEGEDTNLPITLRYITGNGFNAGGYLLSGTVFWATNHSTNVFDACLSAIEVKSTSNWVVQARPMQRLVFRESGKPFESLYLNPHAAGYAALQLSTPPSGTTWRARVSFRPMLSGFRETVARLKGTPQRLVLRVHTGETNIPINPLSTNIHVFGVGADAVTQEISAE